jgi:hypothetical protein
MPSRRPRSCICPRRPCPRRALSSGPQRSPRGNTGQRAKSLTCTTAGQRPARQCFPSSRCSRASIGLAVPGRRSVPGRGGPERRRRPRPDGTGTPRSVLGPWRAGTTGARVVSNGHNGQRGTVGRLASDAGSLDDAEQRIRLWSRRPGVRVPHPTAAGLLPLSTRQVVTDDRPHPSRIRTKSNAR